MVPVLELDQQTASFVRQLEEQRKLEKILLVERVRARDSAEYADALIERLILSVDRLESFPESGQRVSELTDLKVRASCRKLLTHLPAEEEECPDSRGCPWRAESRRHETQALG